jgi:hypothetical protein
MVIAFLALAALAPEGSDPAASVELDRVEAYLFYKGTGRLSDDLLNRVKEFAGWNAIIGEGDAEEPADDLVVAARLTSLDGTEKYVAGPVELSVRNGKGKVIGSRTWKGVLTSKDGAVVLPLWLNDVGCAGELKFTARYNGTTKAAHLALDCGE